ncbi:aconitase/3-isopropylmalate dehydratase large subunit family protein [Pseudonocardia hispaniensis]|uniref:Aconitase/3-isopropylmalate dehydratase large subunit family protein n=1 Tax=Pseudonocardia hispaniensis TaxID=904933 RepID=A0ABW1J4K9_9PSEU
MSGATMTEKILAGHAGQDRVRPGDIAVVSVDMAVVLDLNFYDGMWAEPKRVHDPEKVAVIFDHVVPAPSKQAAAFLARGREFVNRSGIRRFHDVGARQGICHQVIADVPYARPGELLVCTDSHTCSGGALNCAARGVGSTELIYVLAKGYTWFQVGETVRYELTGRLHPVVSAKDAFLDLAGRHGDHVGLNVEFGGPGLAALDMDQRRTLTTMCAEVSAEFALCEPDEVLAAHLRARGHEMGSVVLPDPDAIYRSVRTFDLAEVTPMIGLPGSVVRNTVPVGEVTGTKVDRAFVGSCSNGTLADLRSVADVLRGRRVHPDVTFVVTPGSQEIYREALRDGTLGTISEAGALVTTSSCGMCAGFVNALAAGEVCISSSTRNFKGRMGSPDADIYLGSSASVAAAAASGEITDPRGLVTKAVPA